MQGLVNNSLHIGTSGGWRNTNGRHLLKNYGLPCVAPRLSFIALGATDGAKQVLALRLVRCVIGGHGGGIYAEFGSVISNCLIVGNAASGNGGGIRRATVYNSIISGNTAGGTGGGIQQGNIYNSLISRNTAGTVGGGVNSSALYNSTIVSNTATTSGGGGYDTYFYNSISWDNNKVDTGSDWTNEYSCGVGYVTPTSITNNPLFVSKSDYSLQSASPCRDTGGNGQWAGLSNSLDLAGNARVYPVSGTVDMGAYEWRPASNVKIYGVRINKAYGVPTSKIYGK